MGAVRPTTVSSVSARLRQPDIRFIFLAFLRFPAPLFGVGTLLCEEHGRRQQRRVLLILSCVQPASPGRRPERSREQEYCSALSQPSHRRPTVTLPRLLVVTAPLQPHSLDPPPAADNLMEAAWPQTSTPPETVASAPAGPPLAATSSPQAAATSDPQALSTSG